MARPKDGYKNNEGKRVPGVTTIIGRFKDSGALMYWAFEQGKAYSRREISGLYDKFYCAHQIVVTLNKISEMKSH